MNQIIKQMLSNYSIGNIEDKKNAIKEIVQEIVLCGLSRGGFFKEAAFYGGTALRIFYGLDRFSEDLDFTLLKEDPKFDLSKYFKYIEDETKYLGLNFSIEKKDKSIESNIHSAFLKGNTLEHILTFYNDNDVSINPSEVIKIKLEVDANPPNGASFETKIRLMPSPYSAKLYDLDSLFSGKIHACLCRNWKTRVKGRDFYDYVFLLSNNAKVNLINLKEKLVESNYINKDFDLTIESLRNLLNARFNEINFDDAKADVKNFIKDSRKLDLWNKEFFIEITKQLKARE